MPCHIDGCRQRRDVRFLNNEGRWRNLGIGIAPASRTGERQVAFIRACDRHCVTIESAPVARQRRDWRRLVCGRHSQFSIPCCGVRRREPTFGFSVIRRTSFQHAHHAHRGQTTHPQYAACGWPLRGPWLDHRSPATAYGLTRCACRTAFLVGVDAIQDKAKPPVAPGAGWVLFLEQRPGAASCWAGARALGAEPQKERVGTSGETARSIAYRDGTRKA